MPIHQAEATELEDVRAEIADKTEELEQLSGDLEKAEGRVAKLQAKMDKLLDEIAEKQAAYSKLQDDAASLAKFMYKDHEDFDLFVLFDSATTLEEFLNRLEMRERILEASSDTLDDLHAAQDQLNAAYEQAARDADEQNDLIKEINAKQEEAEKLIAELKEREKDLDFEQKAALAQAAAQSKKRAQTFATRTDDEGNIAGAGWKTGIASAYGGSSDKITPNPGTTATGTRCDDWSVGVAVPIAWGPEKYYGRYVEISYGGQSIIAPVVDCGGMANGERALDLQPGVFKAFGMKTCDEWGLREVRYRFLS